MRLPPKGMTKIGVPPGPIHRNVAMQPSLGVTDSNTDTYTYITRVPTGNDPQTQLLYTADRAWVKLTLTLETAGPVAVGPQSTLTPVLGGTGVLLPTGVPLSWTIAKGTKWYIAATSANRVKVQIEPFPWLQSIVAIIAKILGK